MTKHFDDAICAQHLSGMVRYETVSRPLSADMDFSPFLRFHEYLEQTYPLVHKTLKKEVIGKAALLYTWKGTGKSGRLPIMFTAHQDVVPVGDVSRWRYPPFAGTIAEGRLWGRGSCDCKSNIMAQMEAMELLIAEGFVPDCDIYLGYGYNEEVMGGDDNAAGQICRTLQDRGVQLGLLLDEGKGPGPDPYDGISSSVAYIAVCEKGYADIKVFLTDVGGHSMFPGKRCIIAELGQVAVDIMKHPYPYRATKTMADSYRLKAPLMGERGKILGNMYRDFDAAIPIIDANPALAAMFHTTLAITMAQGSPQANILPTEASFTINSRLLTGDTAESVVEDIRRIVDGRAEVKLLKACDPTAESRTDSEGYACVCEVVEELYPGTTVIPSMVPGGTDAKSYYPICDTVLRFSGFVEKENVNVHNYDEHLVVDGISAGPEFVYAVCRKYCGA